LTELKRLEFVKGNKVDQPPNGGSKDVADAVAGAVLMATRYAKKLRGIIVKIV